VTPEQRTALLAAIDQGHAVAKHGVAEHVKVARELLDAGHEPAAIAYDLAHASTAAVVGQFVKFGPRAIAATLTAYYTAIVQIADPEQRQRPGPHPVSSGHEPSLVHEVDQRHAEQSVKIDGHLARLRMVLATGVDPAVVAVEMAVAAADATHHLLAGEDTVEQLAELYHLMNVLALRTIELEDQVKGSR
jgi:hypothetical protein